MVLLLPAMLTGVIWELCGCGISEMPHSHGWQLILLLARSSVGAVNKSSKFFMGPLHVIWQLASEKESSQCLKREEAKTASNLEA